MEINQTTSALATLGHPARLSVFRLLMRHAPQGVRPTELAETLQIKQNTLSHYLADLEQARLIKADRQGRSIYYSVDLEQAGALIDYLVNDCCRARPDIFSGASGKDAALGALGRPYNVLFICSGNSARSIFAEAILSAVDPSRFRAFSAGTRPGTQLNPFALEVLTWAGLETSTLRSKHISEFEAADAPRMDFVFTVCDAAASEECAPWAGQPLTAHWGVADPVKATGTPAEKALAFTKAFSEIQRRVIAFSALPLDQLERVAIQRQIDDIGRATH